jgi:hypothetical protein
VSTRQRLNGPALDPQNTEACTLGASHAYTNFSKTYPNISLKRTLGYFLSSFVLKPLGSDGLKSASGVTSLENANKHSIPFGFVLMSQSFPSIDAIICTEDRLVTIQVTITSTVTHPTSETGFDGVSWPDLRKRCHLYLTDVVGQLRQGRQ